MASSDRRKKEIGVRKTFGSGKRLLITHFLLEAQIISFIAMAFALILVEWVLPTISSLLQVEMKLEYNLLTILLLIGFAFFTGFLSGIYPACYMSSINILDLIRKSQPKIFATKKGQKIQQSGTSKFKSGLVIFQFSVAMILMVGIIVISQQVQYIKQKDLGFEKDDVLVVNMHDELKHKYEVAKNKLMQMHEIASVSTSRSPLTSWELSDMPHWDGKPTELVFDMGINHVDYDFDETMGLELLSGRFLDKEFAKDATDGFVINEAAVKIMNMEEPIGKRLTFFEGTRSELDGEIIGVVKDMHTESLHTAIKPFAFAYKPSGSYMYIKLKSSANPEIVKSVISQLGKIAPTDPIQYTYLEDVLNDLYISEETTEKLIGYSSLIAIIISCLGLFGLSYYSLQKRIKEIGIRKVNGASVAQILILLNRDFMIWIVIAFVIATPVAWKVIGDWLAKFEYRIDLSWWIFAVVGLIAMMVAFVTISIQAYKVAVRNPVEALRYE
jgi:ABC-type lipoprotein release transport system permease subunit